MVSKGPKRDEAGIAVGKSVRPRQKAPTTVKVLNVSGARLSITLQKKTVRTSDIIRVLEEALAQIRGEVESDAA
jgi:hypothetical protein